MTSIEERQPELRVELPDGSVVVILGQTNLDSGTVAFHFDPTNPDHVEARKQMRQDGPMSGWGKLEPGPDGWLRLVERGNEWWPVAPDEFFDGKLPERELAEQGYAVIACIYAQDGVAGDPEDVGPVDRREVIAWTTDDRELKAWFKETDFEFPETGWHVMGYVYPDGTVLTKEGNRLKSVDWWMELVRAMRRAMAAGQQVKRVEGCDADYEIAVPVPAEAFACRA